MTTTQSHVGRSWRLHLGAIAVGAAGVGAIMGATPAASSQSGTPCPGQKLTMSGPLVPGCSGGGR